MKTGDDVYLQLGGRRYNYTFVHAPSDFDAAVIKNGVGEMRCRKSEIRLKAEVDAEELAAQIAADKVETAYAVALWSEGMKTGKAMAEKSGKDAKEMTRLLRLAKRRGFIV